MPPYVLSILMKDETPAFCNENVTLLFADIKGFTAFSDKRTP